METSLKFDLFNSNCIYLPAQISSHLYHLFKVCVFIVDIFNVQGKSSIYTSFPSRHGRLKYSYIQISKLYTICTDKRSYSIFIFVFGCIYVIIILHALHFILNSYIATLHPTVALFHNFLTDKECEQLRDKGRNRMKATPLTVRKGYSQAKLNSYTDRRTSKIRYISHRKDSLARNINDKISRALDFDLNGEPIAAENFQLMNYGLGNVGQSNRNVKLDLLFILSGGYIELHRDANVDDVNYDVGPPAWLISGERLMTFMVYLSSTEKGGNTVFPLQGVSVPPREGTALFWHTVTSSGYQDQRMKHLGCPVVYGDKWIVNKWIKWHHHMFSHPCHVEKGKFYSINTQI